MTDIVRIDAPEGHWYRRSDDPDGVLLPGVTTILGQMAPTGRALAEWQRRHDADAVMDVCLTNPRPLGAGPEVRRVALALADSRREAIMDAGSEGHDTIAIALDGWIESDEALGETGHLGYVVGASGVVEYLGLVTFETEVLAIREGRYGGTIDLLGTDAAGRVHLVDWKTRADDDGWLSEAWDTEAMQVAAYSGMTLPARHRETVDECHVARITADGRVCLTTVDMDAAWTEWAHLEMRWHRTVARSPRWHVRRVRRLDPT